MAAPTVCTISGTLRDAAGSGLSGVTVRGSNLRPFVHPTDNSLVMDYQVSTTTAGDGTWSLNLVETATPAVTVVITFLYSTGSGTPNITHDYTITVPNSASAVFTSLIGSQI